MGFCQPLFVRFPAPLPVTGVLLPPMYPSGAGFAVFRPVGTGDESRPALGAPLHADAAEYLRFQRLVLWQYRPAEPLAADGIGNRLWADTFLTIVQQQAVAVIVVTAGFPNKGVCPSALCRGHAWQAAARCALYPWYFFAHAFLHFRFTTVFPESRSYPIPAAYPGIGTLSLLRDSGQKRGHGVLPQPVISLSDGHSLVLVHR